jgi:hypothetical protein
VRQYVANPGVEGTLSGWQGKYNPTSGVTLVQIPGGSHDGSWAMQLTNGSTGTLAAGVTNKKPTWVDGTVVPTVAGTTYTGSVWLNGASGRTITLRLNECTAAGTSCRNTKTATVTLAPATWTQLSVPITALANGDSLGLSVYAPLAPGASFLADSFSLTSPIG